MDTYREVIPQEIEKNIGKYIAFGGFGILDGLKHIDGKYSLYKIIELRTDEQGNQNLVLKGYRCRGTVSLPEHNFKQTCAIVTEAEYKILPEY